MNEIIYLKKIIYLDIKIYLKLLRIIFNNRSTLYLSAIYSKKSFILKQKTIHKSKH